ncbi:hypothetical protein LTR86_007476 [Recurvomyces mirabilis]|nr:hypothetical protein LTR86_007476 [Recurvomyces mirabilis]
MDSALNMNTIPRDALLYNSPDYRGIGPVAVPVFLLTNLTAAEQAAYQAALVSDTELEFVHPLLRAWTEDYEGTPEDLFRLWREVEDFAFFVDREGVASTTILVAQPDDYTMLFSSEASQWARENLTAYLQTHKPEVDYQTAVDSGDGAYEGYLETLADDILGKRGLTYGRVPASAFRGIWANLDLANMDMSECVEYHGRDLANGGTVEMVVDGNWSAHTVMGKLWDMIQVDAEGENRTGGEI